MRQVGSVRDESVAKLFVDVLCEHGIDAKVQKTKDADHAIWVLDEGTVEAARALWASFEANPSSPEYVRARGASGRKEEAKAAVGRRSRHEVIDVRRRFRSPGAAPIATFALVATSVLITAVYRFGKRPDFASLIFIGSGEEVRSGRPFFSVLHGEVWRVVTPIFLHMNFLHLLFNMWWLVDLGSLIERRIGTLRFGALVLVTAVASNVCQYWWTGSPFFGGMSGVIYALFGYVWFRGRLDSTLGFFMPPSAALILLVWLALGFTGQVGPVANIAHLSGLAVGCLLGISSGISVR